MDYSLSTFYVRVTLNLHINYYISQLVFYNIKLAFSLLLLFIHYKEHLHTTYLKEYHKPTIFRGAQHVEGALDTPER